jgi:hypothetical protein
MKKLFVYMTLVAAMAMMVVSCSKDDDDTDSTDNRLKFTNLLTQNSTSCTWEGTERTKERDWGNWAEKGDKYAVMRFDRSSTQAIEGTGYVIYFENAYKDNVKDQSEFMWNFANDVLNITYRHSGWAPVHAEYRTSELVINGDKFEGTWFEASDKKFEFSYKKSSFNDWNKYKTNE